MAETLQTGEAQPVKVRPCVFISYSHTTPEHKEWVLQLATRLVEENVDVVLDVWELESGHDPIHFMERIKNDLKIDKVLMIGEQGYRDKANNRERGTGIEAHIITQDIYDVKQTRFLPIVREWDDDGKPCLPTFCIARMHIDLSGNPYDEFQHEKMMRDIHGKPANPKPAFGKTPSYLVDAPAGQIRTTRQYQRVMQRIERGQDVSLREWNLFFAQVLESLDAVEVKDQTVEAIKESLDLNVPIYREVLSITKELAVIQYPFAADSLHEFFEKLLNHIEVLTNGQGRDYVAIDAMRFVAYEMFILSCAMLMKGKHFQILGNLIHRPYLVQRNGQERALNFKMFCDYSRILLDTERSSSPGRGHYYRIIQNHCEQIKVLTFNEVQRLDTLLYYVNHLSDGGRGWYPRTLSLDHIGMDCVFPLIVSKSYCGKILPLFEAESIDELKRVFVGIHNSENANRLQNIDVISLFPGDGFQTMATRL